MRNFCIKIGNFIRAIIDFFYPLFRRLMPVQLFRYAAAGSLNLVFDWVLYFVIFNFMLEKQMLTFWFLTFSSHIGTLVIKFPITLLTGFLLQKYVAFSESTLRGRVQLLRYFLVVMFNLVIYYFGLKFFVEILQVFPSVANVIVSLITVIFSYLGQKKFSFRNQA